MLNSKIQSNSGDPVAFIKQVAQAASGLILKICEGFEVQGAYLDGRQYRWGNSSGRFVNVDTGLGQGFGTRAPAGGVNDAVSLFAAVKNCTQLEAAKRLNADYGLGVDGGGASLSYGPKAPARAAGASGAVIYAENRLKNEGKGEDICTTVTEEELAAGAVTWGPYRNRAGGAFVKSWTYRHADGRAAFVVVRYKDKNGDKTIRQWCAVGEARKWTCTHFPKPRPLYCLPELVAAPDAVVVVVEGEKCADAGASLNLPGVVFTAWAGGYNQVASTDYEPLKGRRVVVWGDLDEPGQTAKRTLVPILYQAGAAEVFTIEAPEKPAKWDCAEAVAAGEDVAAILAGAVKCERPKTAEGLAGDGRSLLVIRDENGEADPLEVAQSIASKLKETGEYYRRPEPDSLESRRRQLIRARQLPDGRVECSPMSAKGLVTALCSHFQVVSEGTDKRGNKQYIRRKFSPEYLSEIIESEPMAQLLEVQSIINAPRLMEDGEISRPGYDPVAQVVCTGRAQVERCDSVLRAKEMLLELFSGFAFTTPGDKARAYAALLLPALRFGPWQSRYEPFPLVFVRADQAGAGKGQFVKAVCEVYGENLGEFAQSKEGLGSTSESLNTQLSKSRPFVLLDNVKGTLDIPALEAFQTCKSLQIRGFNCSGEADPRKFFLWVTSNGCQLTHDQAQRNLQVSITHQGTGHAFKQFQLGGQVLELKEYIDSQRGKLLGAVYALWQEWMRSGRPQARTTHRMGAPMAAVNWVVQNLLGLASCDEGHHEASLMSANPFAQFLRNYALACNPSEPKSTTRIMEEATDANVALPDSVVNQEGDTRKKQQMGRLFGTLFKDKEGEKESVTLGEFVLTRHDERKGAPNENKNWRYTFTSVAKTKEAPKPSTAPAEPVCGTPAPEELATFKREHFTGSRATDPATVRAAFELHRVNSPDEYERQLCAASLHNLRHGAGADGAEADWEASTVGWSEDRKKQARDFARKAVETVRQST
jgi:hypothetical protein